MEYILKFGKKFDREFGKIDKSLSEQVVKKLNRLKENPENIGKQIKTKDECGNYIKRIFKRH